MKSNAKTNLLGNADLLGEMLIYDEGMSETLYRDTEGYWTIGIGFCLNKIEMPESVARYWMREIMQDIEANLTATEDIYSIYCTLGQCRKMAILNMSYQMGVRGVHAFKNMWKALKQGDYDGASRECLDSKWATQTPNRANRIARVIRSDTLDAYDF